MTITVTLDRDTGAERVLTGPKEDFTFRQFAEPVDVTYGGTFGGDADLWSKSSSGLTEYEIIFQGETHRAYRLEVDPPLTRP